MSRIRWHKLISVPAVSRQAIPIPGSHSIYVFRNPMMSSNPHRISGYLLAACFSIVGMVASHAQTSPPPAVGPPAQNVNPATPTAPVKVTPRTTTSSSASPLKQLGLAPGSIHKIGVGLGVAKFKTIGGGAGGWVSFECMEDNKAGWMLGEKYWINLNNVVFISAPFVAAATPAPKDTPAPKATPAPKTPAKAKSR